MTTTEKQPTAVGLGLSVGDTVLRVGKERRGEHTITELYRVYVVVKRNSNGKSVRVKVGDVRKVEPTVVTSTSTPAQQ